MWTALVAQVAHSPYRGITDCVLRMLREEGVAAFYRSYKVTVRASSFALRTSNVKAAARFWTHKP